MKYSLFIGRYQPFHKGHKAIIDKVLKQGKNVLIAIRDTEIDIKNPYTYKQRYDKIRKIYNRDDRVKIIKIGDIEEVCYGRKVGWKIREIKVGKKFENISATNIRKNISLKMGVTE